MARTQKNRCKNPIIGLGSDINKLTIQKSRPLEALWKSDLGLADFKLLDLFLSRIDSHDPERCSVTLEKGEIEEALGLMQLRAEDLSERLLHLGQGIKIPDATEKKGFRIMWLLDEAECEQDENGLWKVTLSASPKSMQYFFNVESLGYFRYKLRAIKSMTSRYTYVLFMYLEKHRSMGLSWDEKIEDLRIMLNGTAPRYDQFKFFNAEILKKCQKEILEKTECRFTYVPVRTGRKVTAIRFYLNSMHERDDTIQQLTLDEGSGAVPAFCDGIFTAAELDQLRSIVAGAPESILPALENGSVEQRRDLLIEQKYRLMRTYDEKKPVKNKLLYLSRALLKETKKFSSQPAAEQEHSFDTQEFLDLAMKRSFKDEPSGGKKE